MMEVVDCIVHEHDLRLVMIAVVVALVGSAATVQLFGRIQASRNKSRLGWIALSAVGLGTMVWCTHFVAMMGFRANAPVRLDAMMTLASLAVAIVLSAPGLALAASRSRAFVTAGGAIVGAAVSVMHYAGMSAYRIDGFVEWRLGYVSASVMLSSVLCAIAFRLMRGPQRFQVVAGGLTLALAVAVLHFTGMAAIRVVAASLHPDQGLSDGAMMQLAVSTAAAGLLFVGCAAVSALIDGETQSNAFKRMRRMALHDGLTDLPNRLCFNEELTVRRERPDGLPQMAVVMLDLSRFKAVNDSYGHLAGDQLLVALASRLTEILRPGEFVGRLGGDEFAALVSFAERAQLDNFLQRLRDVFRDPFLFERFTASVDANVGIAIAPQDGTDADTLLARADLAMYRAKSERSAAPCFYNPAMDEAARERRELASEIRNAVAASAFELHYQPQASISTGEVTGYEVLLRWPHPTRGFISPSTFIPIAEATGQIVPLSDWVLAQACFEAALWPNRLSIAVNISPLHLADPGLVHTVGEALRNSGLPPERLTLELTESAIIMDRRVALERLGELRAMGIGLALDDFGVGYSSLDVLRSFTFDRIKLDKSFFEGIEQDPQAIAILRSVVALGKTLDISVLAEGIETDAQLRIVAEEGCSAIQGYLIGRPLRRLVDPAAVRWAIQSAKSVDAGVSLAA